MRYTAIKRKPGIENIDFDRREPTTITKELANKIKEFFPDVRIIGFSSILDAVVLEIPYIARAREIEKNLDCIIIQDGPTDCHHGKNSTCPGCQKYDGDDWFEYHK